MPTLILSPRHTADTQALWRAANHFGWQVECLTNWRVSEDLRGTATYLFPQLPTPDSRLPVFQKN
ncbi:hypothetical protein H6G17_15670 [Chroococcidiopsis sp. FACHB-1243]|uniref:hypothetical protein n=1 Tax=Chroococcidiopsis sp. [FACHB-1243] TaxID=2692781 RepID=UPI00177BFC07|nr:hypothetical protein [Chroococcidiopsis sp. [FACHB-1243]]MBD2306939.1 hypothetical protein [Chroococcidiopsis sp. [FACHB-1243]]